VLTSLQSLKQLEGLVKEASEALRRCAADNRALREKLTRVEGEHKRAKDELRDLKASLARHERIKARLVKLSEKLERIS
jgi:predicted nuclease with TOPRIM domain